MAAVSLGSLSLPPLKCRKVAVCCSYVNGSLRPITVSGNPPTFVSASGRRIVAVGDLHGDLSKTRRALEMAGVLSSDGQDLWIGGATVLVQLGDILDRGEDEIAILSLLRSLDIQAKSTGGAVFQVNGNHETMNVEGDFRYVDPGAFDECIDFLDYLDEYKGNWDDAFMGWIRATKWWKKKRTSESYWTRWNFLKRQQAVIARSSLLRPGGPLACELGRHSVVLKVDDWIFCHGGLLPHHVAYGLERMNKEVSFWMRDFSESNDSPAVPFIATRGYDSIVWNRLYSRDSADANKYNERIWCIDVGMSSGVLNSRPEVLEIVDDKARVISNQNDLAYMTEDSTPLRTVDECMVVKGTQNQPISSSNRLCIYTLNLLKMLYIVYPANYIVCIWSNLYK
ncbi:serine threonine-protein phosphatase [Musa troglodytarum]|uniref:Serine threonine-protein phosphatase n=1 Tax=Musa troglodytarum TaxID=320322 RepID=A0A9E7KKA1_9LILI|nr:serine threonine-protein phosphatase [Musa troglodytarum]